MEGMESGQAEQMGEEMMKEMMKEFEKMGEKEDFQNVIDGMMRQLLSKEVMYTPMKQICEKYPEWLAENEAQLASEDYERYGHQYQYFQQVKLTQQAAASCARALSQPMHKLFSTRPTPPIFSRVHSFAFIPCRFVQCSRRSRITSLD